MLGQRHLELSGANRIVGQDSLAEDALQDTWPKVLQAVSNFQGGPTACHWVRTLVANSAKDIRRKLIRSREVALTEAHEDSLVADPIARSEDQQMLHVLHEMIARLPEPYRQVTEMRFKRGLSTGETALRLGISRSNAATRLSRSLRMLKNRFDARIRRGKRSP